MKCSEYDPSSLVFSWWDWDPPKENRLCNQLERTKNGWKMILFLIFQNDIWIKNANTSFSSQLTEGPKKSDRFSLASLSGLLLYNTSLLGPFLTYEVNEAFWIWPQFFSFQLMRFRPANRKPSLQSIGENKKWLKDDNFPDFPKRHLN